MSPALSEILRMDSTWAAPESNASNVKDSLESWKRSRSRLINASTGLPDTQRAQALLDLIEAIVEAVKKLPKKAARKFKTDVRRMLREPRKRKDTPNLIGELFGNADNGVNQEDKDD